MKPLINAKWWDHLAPKALIRRRAEVERHLALFVATPAGAEWLAVARRKHGVFRVRSGQKMPVFHLVILSDMNTFVAPAPAIREGHRTVGQQDGFASGRALEDDERVIQPTIRVELVEDPVHLEAARRGITKIDESQITRPSLIFSCPAAVLMRPEGYPKRSFVLYQHIFGSGGTYPDDGWFYVGITTRSWQRRWSEHRRAIERGSPLSFHRKFRDEREAGRVSYIHHRVMGATSNLEALYASEEFLVEGHWHDSRRLNMVPGGKSALRYMREHGMLDPGVVPMPDDRDRIVEKWLEDHPRKGLPAPWVAEKWRDNDWAVAQICGREDRLSVDQVRAIRTLAIDHGPEEIATRIGARNASQVERVLEGKTYSRVK